MATVIGFLFAAGVGLLYATWWLPAAPQQVAPSTSRPMQPVERPSAATWAAMFGLWIAVSVLIWALTWSWALALIGGLAAAFWPWVRFRERQRARRVALARVWPDAIDNLASAVRAGLSLGEAVSQLASSGPEPLRPAFANFDRTYRVDGRFGVALDELQAELADPVADRVCAMLRIARDVGGADVGRLLRTQSDFLRAEANTRAEIAARQSWAVYAARMAVAAPWLVMGLLATRPAALDAYRTGSGGLLIILGAAACVVAYRLMLRITRLPEPARVIA